MTKILTAKEVKSMGELDPTYGQAYWGSVHEQAMPVKFNIKEVLDIPDGAKIQAEEYVMKTSGKGTEYMQLRKVKVEGGSKQTAIVAPPSDVMKLLEIINSKLDEILSKIDPPIKEDVVDEDIGDEPMDLKDIPF